MSVYIISFEGLDYAGKTGIAKTIIPYIERALKINAVYLREPGGTEIGEDIRNLVHNSKYEGKISIRTEALLYQAARAQIIEEKVKPFMESEEVRVIVFDRFRDSSTEYQGVGRGLGIDEIEGLNNFSTDKLFPNLTFLLDIPVSVMRERQANNPEREINRMDTQPDEFYEKIRQKYLRVAEWNHGHRWKIIDATKSPAEVYNEIQDILHDRILSHLYLEGQKRLGKER